MPKTLDVRRHAKRSDPSDEDSGLSAEGHAMAEMLGRSAPPYALVVATPLLRARQTAELIAGRLDQTLPELAPSLAPVLSYSQYLGLAELADWLAFVRRDPRARQFGDDQLRIWADLVARVDDDQSVLIASHGGTIELPAAGLAARLGSMLSGPAFGYCEGVRVTYEGDGPVGLEVIRV
ncbi:MAG: histidine phosphatase family protein [Candidatus Limnocylindria bacterium]